MARAASGGRPRPVPPPARRDPIAPPTPPGPDDAALLAAARSGDGAALGTLVRRHEQTVLTIAARITGVSADAEDVRQRVFLALLERPPAGTGAGDGAGGDVENVGAWLKRCAANAAVDHVRRRSRRRAATRRFAARPAPEVAPPHAAPARRDEAARLHAALSQLDPAQRAALALRFDGDLTFAEAAAALGEPVSTVKSRTQTAIRRLRMLLTTPHAPAGAPRAE